MKKTVTAAFALISIFAASAMANPGIEIVVLGSGGPVADNNRASSGYAVLVGGTPKVLVDAGGGTFQRLGEAGLKASDIDIVLLTHLHIDHTADLPSILKSAYFQKRGDRQISIFGPGGNKGFPTTGEFIDRLFNKKTGLYRYFSTFALKVTKSNVNLEVKDLPADPANPNIETVWEKDGIKITSVAVRHGPTPAVAYRVDAGGECVTFSGDLNSSSGNLAKLALGCDILVYDTAIPENAQGIALKLHSTPSAIGKAAEKANVKKLILSHIMPPAEKNLEQVKKTVKFHFSGDTAVAHDLMRIKASVLSHE